MRRLMLLRHAKTEHDAPSGRDQDRRLDPRGERDAAEMGSWIGQNPPVPDLVMVSPAVRAQQTWEIARKELEAFGPTPTTETVQDLYGAEPIQLMGIIRMASAANPRRLLLVAHNPGLHEIALALTGTGDVGSRAALEANMPTSGLAVIDFEIEDWNDVGFRRGDLVRFVSPKLLRQG